MKKNSVSSGNGRGTEAGRIKLLSWNWVRTLRLTAMLIIGYSEKGYWIFIE